MPAKLSANIDGEFFLRIFRPCFSRVSGPLKQFTPQQSKICAKFSVFHAVFGVKCWCEIFRFRHPSPGKRSTRKISRQISRHLWQRKMEKKITPPFCRVAVLTFPSFAILSPQVSCDMESIQRGAQQRGAYHRHQLDYTHLLIFWELITRTLHLHLHLSIFLN